MERVYVPEARAHEEMVLLDQGVGRRKLRRPRVARQDGSRPAAAAPTRATGVRGVVAAAAAVVVVVVIAPPVALRAGLGGWKPGAGVGTGRAPTPGPRTCSPWSRGDEPACCYAAAQCTTGVAPAALQRGLPRGPARAPGLAAGRRPHGPTSPSPAPA